MRILIKATVVFMLSGSIANALTTVVDKNVGFTFAFPSETEWVSGTESSGDGVTTCAVKADDSGNPLTTICVKTSATGTSGVPKSETDQQKFLHGFIEGICNPYKCPKDYLSKIEDKQYTQFKGKQLTVDLDLQAYKDLNLNGVIFFATLSPKGVPTLFTLNTAAGDTASYKSFFESAIETIKY